MLLLALAAVLLLNAPVARARVGDGKMGMLSSGLGTRMLRANAGARVNVEVATLEDLYSHAHRNTPSSMAQADGGGGSSSSGSISSPTSPLEAASSLMRFAATGDGGLTRTAVGSYSMGLNAGSGESHTAAGLETIAEQAKLMGSTAAASELAKELAWERNQQVLQQHRGW
jgi:hypothetical protein